MLRWLRLVWGWCRERERLLADAAFYLPAAATLVWVLLGVTRAQRGRESDDLWSASFAHDILLGTPLRGWRLPPAPIYFPEELSVLLLSALGLDVDAVYVTYGMVSWAIVAIASAWGARLCGADARRAATSAGALLLFYAIVSVGADPSIYTGAGVTGPLTNPSSHGGAFLCTFLGVLFVASGLKNGFRRAPSAVAAVVLALCAGSDRTLLVHLVAPALLVLGSFAAAGWACRRRVLVAAGLLAAGSLAGLALPSLVTWATGAKVAAVNYDLSWALSLRVLEDFVADLGQLAASRPLLFWTDAVCLALLVLRVVSRALRPVEEGKERAPEDVAEWWLSCSSLAVVLAAVGAVIATSKWVGLQTARYVLPLWLLPPAIALMLIVPRLPSLGRGHRRGVELAALGFAVLMARNSSSANASSADYVEQHPSSPEERVEGKLGSHEVNQACLQTEAARLGLHAGYATYWFARPAMLPERARLNVVPLGPRLGVKHWINNTFWYTRGYWPSEEAVLRYDFAISNELDERWLRARFGEPRVVRQCFRLSIWVYDRPSDVEFRNYIRSEAAALTGDAPGWWDSRDLPSQRANRKLPVSVDDRDGVVLRFEPVPANVVEVVSGGRKPLELAFHGAGAKLGEVVVDFGLDTRRLLVLPEAARGRVDTVVVRSPRGKAKLKALALMNDPRVEALEVTRSPTVAR